MALVYVERAICRNLQLTLSSQSTLELIPLVALVSNAGTLFPSSPRDEACIIILQVVGRPYSLGICKIGERDQLPWLSVGVQGSRGR